MQPRLVQLLPLLALVFTFNTTQAQTDALSWMQSQDISGLFTCESFQTPDGMGGWMTQERREPLGYLGNNYQRLWMHFISVIKNHDDPFEYYVHGKSRFKGNICDFQGVLRLSEATEFTELEYPDERQGTIKGEFFLYEDQKQSGTGTFSGTFTTHWWLDKNGKVSYNGLLFGIDDGYSNNEFTGVWTSHKSGKQLPCNWGDFRMPNGGDLDISASDFIPNEKYAANGWLTYLQAYSGRFDEKTTQQARKKEEEAWWK